MDPSLVAAFEKSADPRPRKPKLPRDIQKSIERESAICIAKEKENYKNDLVPFEQRAAQIKETVEKECTYLHRRIQEARKILKKHFKEQEASHTPVAEDSSFSLFEEAVKEFSAKVNEPDAVVDIELTLMERLKLPWAFMDRCYEIGRTLLLEKKFEEAGAVFFFLHDLQPHVSEYWFGEAISQEGLLLYDDAADTYCAALLLDAGNPFIYFQIARCLLLLTQYNGCLNMLKMCSQYIAEYNGEKDYTSLAQDAKALQEQAEAKLAA